MRCMRDIKGHEVLTLDSTDTTQERKTVPGLVSLLSTARASKARSLSNLLVEFEQIDAS